MTDRAGELGRVREQVDRLQRENAALADRLLAAERQAAAARLHIEELQADREPAQEETHSHRPIESDVSPAHAADARSSAMHEAEVAALNAEVTLLEAKLAHELEFRQLDDAALRARIHELEVQLAALTSSESWRLPLPFGLSAAISGCSVSPSLHTSLPSGRAHCVGS